MPTPAPFIGDRVPTRYTHTIAEIAAIYGVTTQTVRNWISKGLIDAARVGPRLIRVDPGSLRERPLQYVGGDA